MIKYILTIASAFIFFHLVQAQSGEIKYKDLFEAMDASTDEAFFEQLSIYQKQDPTHANVYYQLGIIAQKWSIKYDPLTDYGNIDYFLYKVDLYYKICQKYLDDKEAKKNHIYYHHVSAPEGEKRPGLQNIQADLTSKLNTSIDYRETIDDIRMKYFGAVSNYAMCLSIFHDINNNNSKLKDIYLTADASFLNRLTSLKIHYDSTLYYFDLYIEAIAKNPIMEYNQSYTVLPIETYRLEGLTKSNFLENEVFLWDFKTWVEEVEGVIKNDIPNLRNEIQAKGHEMEVLLSSLKMLNDYSANYDNYHLDDKFAYRVARFDYQPLVLDLFYYNQEKINLFIDSKRPINDPERVHDQSISFDERLKFYRNYISQKGLVQNRQTNLLNRLTEYKANKYMDYISKTYNGYSGLQQFVSSEPNVINEQFNKTMLNLKQGVLAKKELASLDTNSMSNAKIEIPHKISKLSFVDVAIGEYATLAKSEDSYGNVYSTGYYSKKADKVLAFIAKADSMSQLQWVKTFDFSNKDSLLYNTGMQISAYDSGCYVMVHCRSVSEDSAFVLNAVVSLDLDGKDLYKQKLKGESVPRFIAFDDINQRLLMAFHGNEFNRDLLQKDTLLIQYSDSSVRLLWDAKIKLTGNLVDVVRSNEKLLVFSNYSEISINDNKINQEGKISCAMTSFDVDGNLLGLKNFSSITESYVFCVEKLDSETLNVLGVQSTNLNIQELRQNNEIKVYYKLMNMQGETHYTY